MAELSAVSGGSVVEFSVQNHAHAQAPAHVYEEHVFLFEAASQIFPVGHGAGVVLQDHMHVEVVFQDLRNAAVLVKGVAVAVAGDGVYAAGDADAQAHDFVPFHALAVQVLADGVGHIVDGGLVGLHDKGNVVLEVDEAALEVRDGYAGVLVADGCAHKIAGFRVETVDGRLASSGGAGLAQVHHEALAHQFSDEFGGRGNRSPDGFRDGRNAVLPVFDAQIKNGFLQKGVLVIFFFEESLSHIKIFLRLRKSMKKIIKKQALVIKFFIRRDF